MRVGWVVAVAVFVAACGGEARSRTEWSGVVDTLTDGTVHVRNPRVGLWEVEPGRAWSAVPSLRVGSLESGEPDQFGRIGDLAVDPDGRLYVLDALAREIRVFGSDGEWLRTIGRRGRGPGEIELASSLDWGPDGRLWVADVGNGRFQLFDTAGKAAGTHPFAPRMYRHGDLWGPDELLYTWVTEQGAALLFRIVRRRLRGDELVPVDTLPVPMVWEGDIQPMSFQREGRAYTVMVPLPFQATARRVLVPARGWWLSHPGERYRLARTDFTGDTTLITERLYEPVPVREEELRRRLERIGSDIELGMDRVPEHHPPVEQLHVLPDGHLLVRRQVSEAAPGYDVFGPEGVFLGTLVWDGVERFTLHAASDEALHGTALDEFDVPFAVRVDLRRPDHP